MERIPFLWDASWSSQLRWSGEYPSGEDPFWGVSELLWGELELTGGIRDPQEELVWNALIGIRWVVPAVKINDPFLQLAPELHSQLAAS